MSNRPRSMLAVALSLVLSGFGGGVGGAALQAMANSSPQPTFGMRYGSNPRSTGNGGRRGTSPSAMRRAARKRRNLTARAPKHSKRSHENRGTKMQARRQANECSRYIKAARLCR